MTQLQDIKTQALVASEDQLAAVDPLLHQLFWKLRIDRMDSWSARFAGMNMRDLHILKLVGNNPDVILKDIRQELDMPHSTLTSAINRLEEGGLLRRIISQRDRRSYGLELTAKGRAVKEEHDRVDRLMAQMTLDALDSDAERQALIDLLAKVITRLG